MVRSAMVALIVIYPTVGRFLADVADPTASDPLSLLKSLGVGGILVLPFYLWQRDTAKQRDKAMDQLEAQTAAVRESTQAQRAVAAAVEKLSDRLQGRWDRER